MLVADLQSWGKCSGCGEILWVEPSEHDQKCACICGGLLLHNNLVTGETDPTFYETDMQVLLDLLD